MLIKEDLYDRRFVEDWTHRFEDFRAYVHDFTPERVAEITRVPAATIRDLARSIAKAKGCSFVICTGLEYSNSGVQSVRAAWTLQAMADHLEVPGGKLFRMSDRLKINRILTPPPITGRKAIGADVYPLYHQTRNEAHGALLPWAIFEGEPYPVRSLIVGGTFIITA